MQGRDGGCCGDGEEDEAAGQVVLVVVPVVGGGRGWQTKRAEGYLLVINISADGRRRFYLLLKYTHTTFYISVKTFKKK